MVNELLLPLDAMVAGSGDKLKVCAVTPNDEVEEIGEDCVLNLVVQLILPMCNGKANVYCRRRYWT